MDDRKIISLMQRGDTRGLEAAMEKYHGLACAIAFSVLGQNCREDVMECVNSAFHDLWRSISAYDGQRASLKGWVALLVRRRAIDQLRKNLRRHQVSGSDIVLDTLESPETCEGYLEREDLIRLFNEFVRGLPEPDKSIFVRRYFALEAIPDIARRYNMSRGAVDSRLSRLRKALRQTLEGGNQ